MVEVWGGERVSAFAPTYVEEENLERTMRRWVRMGGENVVLKVW